MRIASGLFWIVTVSLFLASGSGSSEFFTKFHNLPPAGISVSPDGRSPLSAERIVATVVRLDGWCAAHRRICAGASSAGHFALGLVDRTMGRVMSSQRYGAASMAENQSKARGQSRSRNRASGGTEGTPLSDGLADLLYDEGEELDDVG